MLAYQTLLKLIAFGADVIATDRVWQRREAVNVRGTGEPFQFFGRGVAEGITEQ